MKYKINLLQNKSKGLFNKSFYFILHYLRYILVLTLLLTIVVFFYKISADQEIIDTTEALSQKKEILRTLKPLIDESRNLNTKIGQIQTILKTQDDFTESLEYLLPRFPEGFNLTDFSTDGKTITFSGKSARLDMLQIFYRRLQKENRFKSVQLDKIDKKDNEFKFNFVLTDFIHKND